MDDSMLLGGSKKSTKSYESVVELEREPDLFNSKNG